MTDKANKGTVTPVKYMEGDLGRYLKARLFGATYVAVVECKTDRLKYIEKVRKSSYGKVTFVDSANYRYASSDERFPVLYTDYANWQLVKGGGLRCLATGRISALHKWLPHHPMGRPQRHELFKDYNAERALLLMQTE